MADETTTTTTAPAAAATTAAPPTAAPAATEDLVSRSKMQEVVDRVTAEKWDATRRAEASERNLTVANETIKELRKTLAGSGTTTTATATEEPTATREKQKPLTAEELQRLVNQQAEVNSFNEKCNASVEEGRKAHNDFDKVVMHDLANLSPVFDPVARRPVMPQSLAEAALETGEAHEVLYALGKDPARAERIMRLSPIKQAVEVAKLHSELVAARAASEEEQGNEEEGAEEKEKEETVSHAPVPIRAGAGRGAGSTRPNFDITDTKKSSMKDWVAQREATLARERQNGTRRR